MPKVKWLHTGSSEDDEEFFIVPEDFDAKKLLLDPMGPHPIIAHVVDLEWAKRITDALNVGA